MTSLIDRLIPALFAAGTVIVSLIMSVTLRGPSTAGNPFSWAVVLALVLVGMTFFIFGLILANRRAKT